MPSHRQLAAILFTDIEGYTAMMQENEIASLRLKDRHRQIMEQEHKRFQGTIIQFYGDGSLSMFSSAVQAVDCALSMQLAFRGNPYVPVRMGLHLGDILMVDDDIFGDGVNVAARVESVGVSGSVLMSDRMAAELSNHPQFHVSSVGSYQFKNVLREIEVFALRHEGLVLPAPDSLTGKIVDKTKAPLEGNPVVPAAVVADSPAKEQSIAVLPFVNMSNDPDQEYFSDGIAEEILNALTTIKDLKIAGRTSSFQFKGKNIDLRTIGEQLGVTTVLEGSVRRQGNRLRVTTQLINVANGFHLWSERYDRDLDDIFAIQDEIAISVTEKLKLTLMDKEREQLMRKHKPDNTAYDLYLKGKFYVNRRGTFIRQALQYLQEAITIDPLFALAHAIYADAILLSAFYGMVPPVSVMEKARVAAETAMRLDPTLSEPYCSLGFYYTCCAWNWDKGEEYFLKAIECNPRNPQAHFWYGLLLLAWVRGNFEQAKLQGRTGQELEPLSAIGYANYGGILHVAEESEESLKVCEMGIVLDPNSFLCLMYKGNALVALKRYDEAIATYEQALSISNRHHMAMNALIVTLSRTGGVPRAKELMQEMRQRSLHEYVPGAFTAMCAANLGEPAEAFANLERAFREKDPLMLTLKYEHWFPKEVREDARFVDMVARIGFP